MARWPFAKLCHEGSVSEMDARSKIAEMQGAIVHYGLKGDFEPVKASGKAPPLYSRIPVLDERRKKE